MDVNQSQCSHHSDNSSHSVDSSVENFDIEAYEREGNFRVDVLNYVLENIPVQLKRNWSEPRIK